MGTWIEARPNLVIPGIIDTHNGDEAHITLAYLGDIDHDVVVETMQSKVSNFYASVGWLSDTIIAEVSGIARWLDTNNDPFTVALVSPVFPQIGSDTVYTLRGNIVRKLSVAGVDLNDNYPFIPHITLPPQWQQDSGNNMTPLLRARHMFSLGGVFVSSGKASVPDSHKQTQIFG